MVESTPDRRTTGADAQAAREATRSAQRPREPRSERVRLDQVCERLQKALGLSCDPPALRLSLSAGTLQLEGEVESLATKRRAARLAAICPGVRWVADKLRVAPARPMSDAELEERVLQSLQHEPLFADHRLGAGAARGSSPLVPEPSPAPDEIWVTAEGGVVRLCGEVPTHEHERLAGVHAWGVEGTRDVELALHVRAPEPDCDDALRGAVRGALARDPALDASGVQVRAQSGHVTLAGSVPSATELERAVADAWKVAGVTEVIAELAVRDAQ